MGIGIIPMNTIIMGARVARAPIIPYIAPDAPIAGVNGLLAVIRYPRLPTIPETKKRVINAFLPILLSRLMPKKNRINILKKRCSISA